MITRREWQRVILFAAVVMLVTALPYLLGALLNTHEHLFGGVLIGIEDVYSYLAKMVQGAQGEWLFHLPYTATPHPGIFLYSFYLVLGKFSAGLGLSHAALYHVARVIAGFICLLVTYRFIAEFVRPLAIRFLALVLSAPADGPGWIAFLLGTIGVWRAGQSGSSKLAAGAGGLWLIMSIIQPLFIALWVLAGPLLVYAPRLAVFDAENGARLDHFAGHAANANLHYHAGVAHRLGGDALVPAVSVG